MEDENRITEVRTCKEEQESESLIKIAILGKDLVGKTALMNKLKNDFKDFVEKVNIDEIYRQLKYLDETKADKKDLNDINDKINDLNDKYEGHQIELDTINRRLDALFSQLVNKDEGNSQPVINVDFSQYVSKGEFEKHKKENEQEFKKYASETMTGIIEKYVTKLKN